jgi:transcriptional regulator with XRE-family HTH domain
VANQQSSTDFNHRLGERVMRLRKANGLSQADLAGMLAARGFSFQQPMIGKVERGERPLKADELAVIAQILSVRASDLLEDSPVGQAAAAATQWRNADAEIAIHRHQIQVHERAIEHVEGLKREAEASLEASGVAVKTATAGGTGGHRRATGSPL